MFSSSPTSSQENLKYILKRKETLFQNEHQRINQIGDKVYKYFI